MREVSITGLGSYLPESVVDNRRFASDGHELSAEDVRRVGVQSRRVAAEHEDVVTMAVAAAERALSAAQAHADSLDFVVLANWGDRRYVPDVAPRIQHALGARRAFAFDLCCACAGFVYGLSVAHGFLQTPRFSRGLVVASDRSSRRVRSGTRASLLFGDAAAAAVVEANAGAGLRIVDYELCTDGTRNDLMDVDADGYLRVNVKQRDLNELAVESLLVAGRRVLERQHLTFAEIDVIVPHSGTAGIQELLAHRLELPASKILTNLPSVGNVTSASIPTALRHFGDLGAFRKGQRVLCLAVGLGWQFVAVLLEP